MLLSRQSQLEQRLVEDDKPLFLVVIIYQDIDTGKRAMRFYQKLTNELDGDCDFTPQLWSTRVLEIPEVADSIAKTAASADLVIFSMHDDTPPSSHFRLWVEKWLDALDNHRPAFAALFDHPRRASGATAATRAYLQEIADRGELDYLPNAT